jgi:serpin B
MKKLIISLVLAIMLVGLWGCTQPASGQVVQSDLPRDNSPVVDNSDLQTLSEDNNAFAFNLYQTIKQADGNLLYSPYSISVALAMTYAGARTETETSMAEALDFTLAQEKLHPAFNSLDLQLKERGEGAQGKDDEGFRLNVVNAIWGQKDFEFLSSYLDVLAQNYGAGLRLVDFINETEKSRVTINDWVSEQTEDKIEDLIPQGLIDDMTRLVLTNAIYFNAAWLNQFNENATYDGIFHTLGGEDVTVLMMRQTDSFRYMETDDYQAIELPYDGQELAMMIFVPKVGQFEAFENELAAEMVTGAIADLQRQEVALTMPKFEYDSSIGLKQALSAMGMDIAFTDNADFSGIDGKRDLFIQDVLHKAFISVDESGTEAAAATAVIVAPTSIPMQPVEMTIDRPFVYIIRDIPTDTTLFVGRVMNPSAN